MVLWTGNATIDAASESNSITITDGVFIGRVHYAGIQVGPFCNFLVLRAWEPIRGCRASSRAGCAPRPERS